MADLTSMAEALTSGGRGILAADESIATMSKRLEAAGIPAGETTRRDYRELLLTAPGLSEVVSGIILCDETFGQSLRDGRPFPRACHELGVLPGIKVDTGTTVLPGGNGALVTGGLDGLAERLADYASRGAGFAKWRAVIDVDTATEHSIAVNAQALARYAALCQQNGLVPIVEPEVLCDGAHGLLESATVTRQALQVVFAELDRAAVDLSGIVLKPNFVTPGLHGHGVSALSVAAVTYDVLRDTVPPSVTGIAFLSGGHRTADACDFLAAVNRLGPAPWHLTFSFGRALVNDALRTWGGATENVARAQDALLDNCRAAAGATGAQLAA